MERSTDNKLKGNYTTLATFYDSLLNDEESLSYWLEYIEEKPFKTVLELASGSGLLAGVLKKKGYDVIASDISKDMKEVSKKNFDGEYLLLDMTNYKLDKKFDLILSICDSINYLKEEDLSKTFKTAYDHLNKNGRFIYDVHSMSRLEEFKNEYVEEGVVDGVDYRWTIKTNPEDKTLDAYFTFYLEDGPVQEHHHENIFHRELIIQKMNEAGFKTRIVDNFGGDEKILVIGEKV